MNHLDVVYLVAEPGRAPHRSHPELRYSLRSLVNVPHRNVWLIGHRPEWATNVHHIPTVQTGRDKYANTTRNVIAACLNPSITSDAYLFHDDMYAMQPMPAIPPMHRGPVADVIADYKTRGRTGGYLTGMEQTAKLLASIGHPDPLSYELHIPLPFNRRHMFEALALADMLNTSTRPTVLHKRTWYGTIQRIGGHRMDDVKIHSPKQTRGQWADLPWLSTGDGSWLKHDVGRHIRDHFPNPSRYEKT